MVFGNVRDLKEFSYLEKDVLKCFAYAKNHDLLEYEKGSYKIEGDNLFVNIVEYETTTTENRFWEAHRKYLDLHLMLKGAEQIDVNFIDNLEQKEFVDKDDFLPAEGGRNGYVILEEGDFLLCYPKDAHRTAVQVNEPEAIKKAIFKIKIK